MPEGNIENITKSDSNLAPKFDSPHLLPGMNFNGPGLIKKYFYPLKSNNFIYFLRTKSMVKKFKHRFYII